MMRNMVMMISYEMRYSALWKSYAILLTTALILKKSYAWALRFQLRSNF